MNWPPSTRQGIVGTTWPGALSGEGAGGYCEQPNSQGRGNPLNGACMLFSQPSATQLNVSTIVGPPTNNAAMYRTNNIVNPSSDDWTRLMPWRAPGTSIVLGSGCGVAGGGDTFNHNGGWAPTGMAQGADAIELPGPAGGPVTKWDAGSTQKVAWGMWANHGGGYSYRLCLNKPGKVTEECFQRTQLDFAPNGGKQWLQPINGSAPVEIKRVTLSVGTYPAGSQWTRNPIPSCATGGKPVGHGFTDTCNETEYAEPIPGMHGFGYCNSSITGAWCVRFHHDSRARALSLGGVRCERGSHLASLSTLRLFTFSLSFSLPTPHSLTQPQLSTTRVAGCDTYHDYSIVDEVVIPKSLAAGDYLLSWRWDCEQTHQIWQNCADVSITN